MLDPSKQFKTLKLSKEILANLDSLGYLEMTPIQEKGLPFVLGSRDFIGQANTGSGKTAVFGLGILAKLDLANNMPQALVLCPTRELADQVTVEIRRLARFTNNIKVLTLAGGSKEIHKMKSLKQGAHIIVGTPGRISKLLEKGALTVSSLKILVLDEADRLLEMGFINEINHIASFTPSSRQTLLFSATFPNGIKNLSASIQENAEQVSVDSQHEQNTIKQHFFMVEDDTGKFDALSRLLGHFKPESTLVFCRSKEVCTEVVQKLRRQKVDAAEIHAELDQQDRTLVLIQFANKSCRVLVATDVIARGLDIKEVSAVINYDLPKECEQYVHRIGRTGRAGREGLALSLFTARERPLLDNIAKYLKTPSRVMEYNELDKMKIFSLISTMATIYISGGRKDNIRPGDILGALTGDAGLLSTDVGNIKILEVNSYAAISVDQVDAAVAKLQAGKIKGKKFKVGKV